VVTSAADAVLAEIAKAVLDDRSVWLVRGRGSRVPRVTLWIQWPDGEARPGPGALEPVIDELVADGLIDISPTAGQHIGGVGPVGWRVQPTPKGWALRSDLPAEARAARMQTWRALP